MRLLFRKTLRDLRATWAQSLSLVAIVAIGVAAFVALTGAYRNLSASYDRTYRQLQFEDADFSVRPAPETAAQVVARVRGVAAVTARLVVDAGLRLSDGEEVRARLIGLPDARRPAVNDLLVQRGRFLAPGDADGVVLESNFAKARGLRPGDAIASIVGGRTHLFRVAGLAVSPEYLLVAPTRQEPAASARSFAVVFVPLATLQRLTAAQGKVNDLAVRLAPTANRATVARGIEADLAAYGIEAVTWRRDQPSNALLRSTLDSARTLATLAPLLILIAAAVSLYLMLGRTVRAQRPLIGLMKALGYRNRSVRRHYLAYALTIGVAGAAAGLAGGLPLAGLLTSSYADRLGIPLVDSRLHPELLVIAAAVSVVLAALAGLAPARAAMRLAPAQAMRMDPAASALHGRGSLIERLVHLPLWLRLPLRNVFRARRRSISTAAGVLFSFVLLLMVLGLISSVNDLFDRTYNRVERWDAVATFSQPISSQTIGEMGHWRGVRQLVPSMRLPATVHAGGRSSDVLLTAFAPSQTMHVLQLPPRLTPSEALAPGRIVVPQGLADELQLARGDAVTLDTPAGSERLRVGAISEESRTSNAYISLAEAARLTRARGAAVNTLYLRIDPSLTRSINARLYAAGASSVEFKATTEAAVHSRFNFFLLILYVLLAFVVAMAFALLFNAMTVSVTERQRELATMRAIGTRPSGIARLMVTEISVLWLVALAPGLLLGNWVATAMVSSMQSSRYFLWVVIAPSGYALTALAILATMMLAALPAIRRVNRADLAQATKVLT